MKELGASPASCSPSCLAIAVLKALSLATEGFLRLSEEGVSGRNVAVMVAGKNTRTALFLFPWESSRPNAFVN